MIYNFNLGIGWASSGVEYAQSYRGRMLRNIGADARFIFIDLITYENIEAMTANIGFPDREIIWLYTYFTDFKTAPVTYTLDDLKGTIAEEEYTYSRDRKTGKIVFEGKGNFYTVYFTDETSDFVHRVEIVSAGRLIRKDYFTYGRIFSEYYAPLDGKAHLYLRRFFNTDGSTAYDEINDDGHVMYQFKDQILCSREEFVGYMVRCLNLTGDDTVIIDRTTGIGQAILKNAGDARTGIVIHADHFSEGNTDDEYILWNNFYEYSFAMHKHISFYITATAEQNRLLKEQFKKYMDAEPDIYTIPVGSIDELKYPENGRKPFSLITASRLAAEKHIDRIIEAVSRAHEQIPGISLDIYGKGGEEERLRQLIDEYKAAGYIRLMGQHNLEDVYQNYEVYVSASMSEGFGLTLLEAIGAGLPVIGFNVRYGNPEFIDDGENGCLIPVSEEMTDREKTDMLTDRLITIFRDVNLDDFHNHSYEKAGNYLTEEVQLRWKNLLGI